MTPALCHSHGFPMRVWSALQNRNPRHIWKHLVSELFHFGGKFKGGGIGEGLGGRGGGDLSSQAPCSPEYTNTCSSLFVQNQLSVNPCTRTSSERQSAQDLSLIHI